MTERLYPRSTTLVASTRRLHHALRDLYLGLQNWQLWSALGWNDIRLRYRRSMAGPFWLTISMAIMIAGIGYMYSGLFGQDINNYLPYVAVGIIVFSLITNIINESTVVFIAAAGSILHIKAPLSIFVYQMIWRNFIIFAHNILIYFVVVLVFPIPLGITMLLSLLGLLLIATVAVSVGVTLATLSTRFRDVPPIVTSIMQVAFFLTPIFWRAEALHDRQVFVQFNPFYYFLEIVRQPLLGHAVPAMFWWVAIGMNLIAAFVAVAFFARFRARVAYWL